MRLQPRTQWICDTCGQPILKPEEGMLECRMEKDGTGRYRSLDFRLVHHVSYSPRNPHRPEGRKYEHESCYQHSGGSSWHLHHVIAPDGIARLLGLLDVGPELDPDYSGPEVVSIREWVELFRRLTIPFYEEARLYWRQAKADGWFDGANEVSLYSPQFLQDIIKEFAPKEEPPFRR